MYLYNPAIISEELSDQFQVICMDFFDGGRFVAGVR